MLYKRIALRVIKRFYRQIAVAAAAVGLTIVMLPLLPQAMSQVMPLQAPPQVPQASRFQPFPCPQVREILAIYEKEGWEAMDLYINIGVLDESRDFDSPGSCVLHFTRQRNA